MASRSRTAAPKVFSIHRSDKMFAAQNARESQKYHYVLHHNEMSVVEGLAGAKTVWPDVPQAEPWEQALAIW